MQAADLNVAQRSLEKSQFYYNERNYGRAFAHFLLYFELVPNILEYRSQFIKTLQEWGSKLQEQNRHDDLAFCYKQALKYFPDDKEILYHYWIHTYRLPVQERDFRFNVLKEVFKQSFLESEKTVRDIALMLLPRWHFRMVNDYQRNMAYYKAILDCKSDKHNIKALDIGAGCGLLSLFASHNSNIDNIIAIESNESLAIIAKKVFKDNRKNNIDLINKHSSDLTSQDINGKADLLVTEIFDVALFGEHCLETIIHAWEHLLTPDATIIPASASLYVTGIWCPDILIKQLVMLNLKEIFPNSRIRIDAMFTEPYDALDLKNLEWKQLTNIQKILTVNFHDIDQMQELFNLQEKIQFELKCIEAGTINAFAAWFDLHLDENTTITTNPRDSNARCWEQAIFHVKSLHTCNSGDRLKLNFSCHNSCVAIHLDVPFTIPKVAPNFQVAQDIVSYLNDNDIFGEMKKLSELYDNPIKLMDLSPFPLFGLFMAKKGSTCICRRKGESFVQLILYFMTYHKIKREMVQILTDDEVDVILSNDFDVILIDVISEHGTLLEDMFRELEHYQKCLKPDGALLPKEIQLNFQIVTCDYLHYCSRVNDDTTFGFQIANQMNALAINEQWIIDKEIEYIALTNTTCLELSRAQEAKVWEYEIDITRSGIPHGVLYWFKLVYADNIEIDTFCSTFYNSACFIVSNGNEIVPQNSVAKVIVHQLGGLLQVQCSF